MLKFGVKGIGVKNVPYEICIKNICVKMYVTKSGLKYWR